MKMKSIKKQILFGFPILAALSALPRVAQAQEEIRFDGNITLKAVEEAQVACTREVASPIWKAVFGRDLGQKAKADPYVSLESGFSQFATNLSDGGNRISVTIAAYSNDYTGSFIGFNVYRNSSEISAVGLRAKAFPVVVFEVPENSPYDSLGNPVSKEFALKNVRIILNEPMNTRAPLQNEYTKKFAHFGIDTARYVSCLSSHFRQ